VLRVGINASKSTHLIDQDVLTVGKGREKKGGPVSLKSEDWPPLLGLLLAQVLGSATSGLDSNFHGVAVNVDLKMRMRIKIVNRRKKP
jgi:hypothetical protein